MLQIPCNDLLVFKSSTARPLWFNNYWNKQNNYILYYNVMIAFVWLSHTGKRKLMAKKKPALWMVAKLWTSDSGRRRGCCSLRSSAFSKCLGLLLHKARERRKQPGLLFSTNVMTSSIEEMLWQSFQPGDHYVGLRAYYFLNGLLLELTAFFSNVWTPLWCIMVDCLLQAISYKSRLANTRIIITENIWVWELSPLHTTLHIVSMSYGILYAAQKVTMPELQCPTCYCQNTEHP